MEVLEVTMKSNETIKFQVIDKGYNSWCDFIEISKGPYSTKIQMELSDLRDVNGLDASVELLQIITMDLEGGHFGKPHQIKLTNKEKAAILDLIQLLRKNSVPQFSKNEVV